MDDSIIAALDDEAARMTADRGPGASKVTRSEAVKVILAHWLESRPKLRQ